MGVEQKACKSVIAHYHNYRDTYKEIWNQLDLVRDKFQSANRDEKITYIQISYIYAVLSVRAAVSKHEQAFSSLIEGENPETALQGLSHNQRKQQSIQKSLNKNRIWLKIAILLEQGAIDTAHQQVFKELLYVGPVKSPFVLANIGYTEKMCLDSNLATFLGMESTPRVKTVEQYERLCAELCSEFPVLSEELDPYHLQWVIFDWERHYGDNMNPDEQYMNHENPVTKHKSWFNGALSNPAKLADIIESLA